MWVNFPPHSIISQSLNRTKSWTYSIPGIYLYSIYAEATILIVVVGVSKVEYKGVAIYDKRWFHRSDKMTVVHSSYIVEELSVKIGQGEYGTSVHH